MGIHGWGFGQCEYCEYQVEDPWLFDDIYRSDGCFALCGWCWTYILDQGGEPNDPGHWWATWRWEANRVRREWSGLPPEACERVASFLVQWRWKDFGEEGVYPLGYRRGTG